jgi:hypothetical protein
MLYRLIFRPVNPQAVATVAKKKLVSRPVTLSKFEGKVIRDIHIITYDPFGYDPRDTSIKPQMLLPKAGNAVHVKTWPMKIKNVMIVKRYDTFDSLRIKESERLIRSQPYVREVYTSPVLTNDSVDLYIRVYDVWSILITGALTQKFYAIDGRDKNFMGAGHQVQLKYRHDYTTGKSNYNATYFIPNIYDTYVNSTMYHSIDENKNTAMSVSLDRPFYSVFTSWAGGISLQKNLNRGTLYDLDSTIFEQKYRSITQNYWVGRSWQLFKGKTEEKRTTSFITSARYYRVHFQERAAEIYDSARINANEDFYMGGIGIAKRLYKQDNYIFRYGFIEDVPTGRAYSLVGGYQIREKIGRFYAGGRVYMANYHDWGYFNIYFEYGTFIRGRRTEEGCFSAGINYFSNIIKIGRWKLRQFIKPQYIIGFDRPDHDNLTLSNDYGIKGFNSFGIYGKERLSLTFQLQSYAPWNIIGFRFGPYLVSTVGMLGSQKSGFSRSPLYSSFGIGLLIKNDYLVTSHFQISLVFYPIIPGVGNNVIKVNPVKTSDFGFRGFDISQPTVISYN